MNNSIIADYYEPLLTDNHFIPVDSNNHFNSAGQCWQLSPEFGEGFYWVYAKKDLKNPAAIIDANHSNSNKQFKEQIRIVSEILHSRRYNDDVKKMVKGVMIESYIEEGNQKICDHMTYGKSITDPCLGWEDTEKLIYKIAEEC